MNDKNIRISDILSKPELRSLLERRNRPGLLFLTGHLAVLAASGVLLWSTWGSVWAVPATLLHGVVIVHLFAPFHECAHGTAFRSAWLNRAGGWFTGLATLLPPLHFYYEHLAHHNYTQQPERDPQMIPSAERLGGYLYYATAIPYFRGVFGSLIRHALGRFSGQERQFIPTRELPRVQRQAWIMWAVYATIAVLSFWLQSWVAVIYWLLPRFAGEPVMRFIRMSEHVGCPRIKDIWRNTRTVLTLAPLRWLAWNMAYHAEHHALAAAPFHALPALHRQVGDRFSEVRRGYLRTQVLLLRNALANARDA